MEEITTNVSWLAVIVGAVVAFLAGWIWYGPLFGKGWAAGVGVELGSASDMPVNAMIFQAVGLLLMSWFVAVTAASNLLLTVILGTVAFTVMGMSGSMFRKNSDTARNVDAGFWIVALAIMIAANGLLR